MTAFTEPISILIGQTSVIHYPTIDQVFDGKLVQSCDFCNADQLRRDHDEHCSMMQAFWKQVYGALPEPSIPVTGLVID